MSGTTEGEITVMPRESRQIAVRDDAPSVLTPMDMLNQAVSQGANIDVLEKLMALQERWEANNARKAFEDAITQARATMPTISKNKLVDFVGNTGKRTTYRHETLDEVIKTILPHLAEHGLSARFRTAVENGTITVTCRIAHKDGYAEENSLPAPADMSGNKNPIQAIGSTVTYLQRYTLKAALGLAAAEDDDARSVSNGNGSGTVSDEQVEELMALAARAGADIPRFCKYLKVTSLAELPARRFDDAVAALKAKEAKR